MIEEYRIDYDKAEQQEDGTWQAPIGLGRTIGSSRSGEGGYGRVVLAAPCSTAWDRHVIAFILGKTRYEPCADVKAADASIGGVDAVRQVITNIAQSSYAMITAASSEEEKRRMALNEIVNLHVIFNSVDACGSPEDQLKLYEELVHATKRITAAALGMRLV